MTPYEHLHAAVEQIITEGRETTDPIERAQWFEAALDDVNRVAAELATARREAVREARQRMSVPAIQQALGLSRARIYQMLDPGGVTFDASDPDQIALS